MLAPTFWKTNPSAYLRRVRSKFLVGPATLFVQGVPSDARTVGAVGTGYGMRSGGAVGIGDVLWLLLFCVKPVKPVSSPVTVLPPLVIEPSGSTSGPKVRRRMHGVPG